MTTPFPPFVTGFAVVQTTLGLAEGDALLLAITALGEGDGDLLALGDGEGDPLVLGLAEGDDVAVAVSSPPP